MSNPALTSVLLWQFAKSYEKENETGPPLSLCFIVLPIVMSRLTVETFTGTNIRTGFLTWLARHPELTLQLPTRVGATRDLTAFRYRVPPFQRQERWYPIGEPTGHLVLKSTIRDG